MIGFANSGSTIRKDLTNGHRTLSKEFAFVLFLDIYGAAKRMKTYRDLIIRACSIFIAYVD
jgi:hypothetical protein